MTFNLFGADFYFLDELFGFWLGTVKDTSREINRSLFAVYWDNGNFMVDLFWFHVVDTFPINWITGIR